MHDMNIEEVKQQIGNAVCTDFPNLHSRIEPDLEDGTVFKVRVYGVADECYSDVHARIQEIILGVEHCDGYDFVPSVIRMSDTRMLFPSMVPCDLSNITDSVSAYEWDRERSYSPVWNVSRVTLPEDISPKRGCYAIAA